MRNAYLSALHELARSNKNVLALISDNGAIVYDKFRADFPGQYTNCGISEANMVGMAAGLASSGKIPFAYTISNFLVTVDNRPGALQDVARKIAEAGIDLNVIYGSADPKGKTSAVVLVAENNNAVMTLIRMNS